MGPPVSVPLSTGVKGACSDFLLRLWDLNSALMFQQQALFKPFLQPLNSTERDIFFTSTSTQADPGSGLLQLPSCGCFISTPFPFQEPQGQCPVSQRAVAM